MDEKISADEALLIVEAAKKERVAACAKAIQDVLQAHGCVMEPVVQIRDSAVSSSIVIRDKE